jgi:ABC transport system ATP-binding/permease protein
MTLVRFDEVFLEFGDQPLLESASFAMEPNERVCLIGRNGAGKTSLLRLITGAIQPDGGEVHYASNLRVSQLEQTMPDAEERTVRAVVRSGLAEAEELLQEYDRLTNSEHTAAVTREMEDIQQRIDAQNAWNIEQRVETVITELSLPADKKMSELSGGWRRRVALGKALISQPELLLLDEPTNHLDIATINWLENTILGFRGSVLFITHDRAFLQRLATRIVEIDRGKITSWPGDYQNFLVRKEKALEDEATANAKFDKRLAEEEAWIRQGVKARRTRNEGRKRALISMREAASQRRKVQGSAYISIDEADTSGKKVIRAKNLHYAYGDEKLINGLSLQIMRGDRIGLVGNNGVGKSTLLRLLLGELEPQQGTIKLGTNLEVGYFDQLRQDLDLTKSVAANINDKSDYVTINGKQRHIVGYLKGFLFSPKRSQTPVKALSGGERNRLILAKLFTKPTNLLVLDEPTNDLDVETLDVLEDRLEEYQGTLIVVSHDRQFLDNTVTSILVFEDGTRIRQYVGGYSDWLRQGHQLTEKDTLENAKHSKAQQAKDKTKAPTKISYKEQTELRELPAQIEALENEIALLQAKTAAQNFYAQDYATIDAVTSKLTKQNAQLEQLGERWLELEDKQAHYDQSRK